MPLGLTISDKSSVSHTFRNKESCFRCDAAGYDLDSARTDLGQLNPTQNGVILNTSICPPTFCAHPKLRVQNAVLPLRWFIFSSHQFNDLGNTARLDATPQGSFQAKGCNLKIDNESRGCAGCAT